MRLLWCLVMFVLVGCAPDRIYHGSTAFSECEREQIEAGNVWISKKMGQDPFKTVWDSDGTEDLRIDREHLSDAAGRFWPDTGRIVIDAGQYPRSVGELAAHEFGHAHGYPGTHHPGRESWLRTVTCFVGHKKMRMDAHGAVPGNR